MEIALHASAEEPCAGRSCSAAEGQGEALALYAVAQTRTRSHARLVEGERAGYDYHCSRRTTNEPCHRCREGTGDVPESQGGGCHGRCYRRAWKRKFLSFFLFVTSSSSPSLRLFIAFTAASPPHLFRIYPLHFRSTIRLDKTAQHPSSIFAKQAQPDDTRRRVQYLRRLHCISPRLRTNVSKPASHHATRHLQRQERAASTVSREVEQEADDQIVPARHDRVACVAQGHV